MNSRTESFNAIEFDVPAPTVLPALIGFFLSFRLFFVLLSVRAFGTDPQTGVGISLALNIFLFGCVALQSIGTKGKPTGTTWQAPTLRWIFAYIAFAGCSLTWTVAVSLPAAIAYWLALAADVGMVTILLRSGQAGKIGHSLMAGYVWGASLIAVIAWVLPSQSDLRLGDEELLGPNQIGYLCAFAFFFAQYLQRETESKWQPALILLALTLLRSLSKTSIVAFLAAQAFLLLKDRTMARRTKLLLIVATLAVTTLFSSLLLSYFDVYRNAGNQSETLTGRIGIWAFILEEAMTRPWFGHGFHSVWKVIPPFAEGFEARHAHNELLQQFYAYGAVGVCIMTGLYGSFYLQIRKMTSGRSKVFLASMLLFVLVRGLADTESFDLSFPLWAIALFTLIGSQAIAIAPKPKDNPVFYSRDDRASGNSGPVVS